MDANGRKLQLYFTQYGSYPTGLDASSCPTTPVVNSNYCLKTTNGNSVSSYSGTPTTYFLIISRGPISYKMTDSTAPVIVGIPSAPTVNSITPGLNQLSVSFSAGADGGSAITNYEYSTDGGGVWTTRSPVSTTSPLVIAGLSNSTLYNVKIRAVNSSGPGVPSSLVSIATLGYPGSPTLASVVTDYGQLNVGFSAGSDGGSTITNYEYSTDGGTTWTARSPASTSSPFMITGLANNTSYNVRLRAVNSNGSGTQSNQIAGSTLPYESPTCTWGGYSNPVSTFTITNVLSTSVASYGFAPTTGTVSFNQSTGVFTVTTSNEFEVTVTPKSLTLVNGPSRIVGRKNITYYTYTTGGGCLSAVPCGMDGCDCTLAQWCCSYSEPVVYHTAENSPPPNYQKIGSVWVRL